MVTLPQWLKAYAAAKPSRPIHAIVRRSPGETDGSATRGARERRQRRPGNDEPREGERRRRDAAEHHARRDVRGRVDDVRAEEQQLGELHPGGRRPGQEDDVRARASTATTPPPGGPWCSAPAET